jgi:hypothetical protein
MHVDEPCTAYFKYPILDCPIAIYVYKHVYTLIFAMLVLGCESWFLREWDKTGRTKKAFLGALAGVSSKQLI